MPWKNGGGLTRTIAAARGETPAWRISRAQMEKSGPFSSFPGYSRSVALVQGGPVRLQKDAEPERTLSPLAPFVFSGEAKIQARVEGLAQDFNLFTLESAARGKIYPCFFKAKEEQQFPLAGQEHFIHCVAGRLEVFEPSASAKIPLAPGDTYGASRRTDQEYLNLRATSEGPAAVLWVVIHLTQS